MITEKGKAFIARNFGVNNCYALEDVVSCTVYTKGAPSERVLDTPTIVFLLTTEIIDWVRTPTGRFTLADLVAANEGNYISMMEALSDEAYCIPGAAPPTAPVAPPITPLTTAPGTSKDFEILNPSVNCDSTSCHAKFDLKNNSSSGSAYVRLKVDGVACYQRYVYVLKGRKKPQVLSTSIRGLSPGYHNLTIVVGKVTDTDTYTHRFHVGVVGGIEPPAPVVAKIMKAGIIDELKGRGAIDTAAVSTVPGDNKWYMYYNRLGYHTANFEKAIEIRNLQTRNPPTQTTDISLTENKMTPLAGLDRDWVLARLGELPFKAVTPPTVPVTGALPAPTNIRVTDLRPDYAYVEWDGILECCSDPNEPREYCGCEFGITLNGVSGKKVFSDPHPGTDCEELTPGTRYTLEIQTRSPPNIYRYREPSEKVSFTFTTPTAPPAAAVKITKAEIITELRKRGAIDTAAVSTVPGDNKWYMYYNRLGYHTANFEKDIEIRNLGTRNPPTQTTDISLTENRTSVSGLDRDWVLARLAELPYAAPPSAPPTAASLSAPEFIAEIRRRGTLDLARISMIPGDNKWFRFAGQLIYRVAGGQSGIVITSPGKSNMYAAFSKNERTVTRVERNWAMARIGELPFTAAPAAPPATAVEPSEPLKNWIAVNYGDGTRVTSDGWRKLNTAKMANALATLPAGYSKGDITEGVVLWAKANPNWETRTICGWISSIRVTSLTEDHGLYVYNLAIGWTTLANKIYATLSPKPSKPPAAIVTEDNGLGVYDYAIGWKTLANTITGCNF